VADCQNCRRLSQENQELRRRIAELERKVFRLWQTIERARAYALAIYNQARQVLSHHQARATWAYHRGRGEIAAELYNILNVEE